MEWAVDASESQLLELAAGLMELELIEEAEIETTDETCGWSGQMEVMDGADRWRPPMMTPIRDSSCQCSRRMTDGANG